MPETFYESIKEPPSPVLTTAVLGDYLYSDPLAGAAWNAGMTQARFISLLLKDRARMQAELYRLHSLSPVSLHPALHPV
jgi:hypothetical protein